MKRSRLFFFIMVVMSGSGSYGTYSVDEAFEQMSHSSPLSAVVAKQGLNFNLPNLNVNLISKLNI